MKYFRILHKIFGVIPFVWFSVFLMILMIGIFKLRSLPKYGYSDDPNSLGIDLLSRIHLISAVSAYVAYYLWLVFTICWIAFFKKKFFIHKPSTILFFIGISGFFVFKYFFPEIFKWVMD